MVILGFYTKLTLASPPESVSSSGNQKMVDQEKKLGLCIIYLDKANNNFFPFRCCSTSVLLLTSSIDLLFFAPPYPINLLSLFSYLPIFQSAFVISCLSLSLSSLLSMQCRVVEELHYEALILWVQEVLTACDEVLHFFISTGLTHAGESFQMLWIRT